jgi:hypothetical protein
MSRLTEYKKLVERTKAKGYDVRELPACFVIATNNTSIICYRNGEATPLYTLCLGDKREVHHLDQIDDAIDVMVQSQM